MVEPKIIRKTFALKPKQIDSKSYDPEMPMNISGIANMAAEDRVGDIVVSSAWVLDNYLENPVILFNHNYASLVGKATSIEANENGLEVTAEIGNPQAGYELTETQEEVRSLLAQGILKAFSVGFIPHEMEWDDANNRYIITKAELLEISLVTVPCQQNSLVSEVKHLREKTMDEEQNKLLMSIAETTKACLEKIAAVYDKLEGKSGDKPEDKPKEPNPIEESLRQENTKLKSEITEYEKLVSELANLIK